jgi:hypothetical protein
LTRQQMSSTECYCADSLTFVGGAATRPWFKPLPGGFHP